MDAEQDLAASKMAAAQRGRQARKDAQEQKEAASKVAAMQKGKNARKQKKEEDKASVAIQSRYRGKRERAKTNTVRFEGTQRYYTPAEVGAHNRFDDLWVSFFGKVCNLTSLVASNPGHLVTPIIEAAGTDISHWFDPVTKQVRTFIDPETEFEMPYTPMGVFLHCPPPRPTADWNSDIGTPWWKDKKLSIGQLTAKTRKITLFNMLTKQSTTLEVRVPRNPGRRLHPRAPTACACTCVRLHPRAFSPSVRSHACRLYPRAGIYIRARARIPIACCLRPRALITRAACVHARFHPAPRRGEHTSRRALW